MIKGYWIPVLHSHLPFVKHPEHKNFLEEFWLFEAITECYIPLLQRLKKLDDENIDFALTISVTPPLAEMLDDIHLMEKYDRYLETLIELGHKEVIRTKDSEYENIAKFYLYFFTQTKEFFDGFLNGNVLNGYRYFYDKNKIEVITCGATHGFLPLLSVNKEAVNAQIKLAKLSHEKHFNKSPKGIWLPECAYYDGLDVILNQNGIEFFIMDAHGIVYSDPTPKHAVYAPIITPNKVAAFGRDNESSKQVWSSKDGYPGDFCYRDFYRDIGYDLDFDYIKDYINPDGVRVFTGFKYHKITGNSDYKEIYDPLHAAYKTIEHAQNFHFNREKQITSISSMMDRLPIIVSPYDAELFGHWWFEGPEFLYNMFKEIDAHKVIKAITPVQYLNMYTENFIANPHPSSWGDQGYYDVWLNKSNDWIYRHLHEMADVMVESANLYKNNASTHQETLLNQMSRELLLAQSSDWAFLMTTATATEYSEARTKEHIGNFFKIKDMLDNTYFDEDFFTKISEKNSIFDFINFRTYCSM
jgi:1,4-alpha-glucan branching enzyme